MRYSHNVHFTNAGVLFFTKSIDYLLRQAVCTCVLYKGIDKFKILDRKDYKSNMLSNYVILNMIVKSLALN